MTSPTPNQSQFPSSPPHLDTAASGIVRLLKIVVCTVLGFALLILGIAWLVAGIVSRELFSIIGGALALAILAGWVVGAMLRSRREVRRQSELATVKLRAGQRTCAFCKIDFDEATSLKTAEAWYHTAISVTLSLIPIGLGGIGLWALGFSSVHSIKLLFILIVGVACLIFALQGRRRLYVHCPQCGRSCGWTHTARGGN